MAEENKTQVPLAAAPGNEGGTPQKLYAGKYKTLEDAVELGYGGLQQGFNDLSEKVGNLTRLLEVAVAPQEAVPQVQQGGPQGYSQPDPYGRNLPPQPNAADFIMNPYAILEQRDNALMNKMAGIVTNTVTNAMAVADFKLRNPDLVKHEPLVRTFMNNTDPRKPVNERLEDAAKAARAYISQNFQQPTNAAPAGGNYVEAPRGSAVPFVPGSSPAPAPDTASDEQALVDYLAERNAIKAQNMGVGVDNK